MLIGLVGPAGSGKDTVYGIIKDAITSPSVRLAFGDGVKDMAKAIFNITSEEIEIFKRNGSYLELLDYYGDTVVDEYGMDSICLSFREILHRIGTETRNQGVLPNNYWVEQVQSKIIAMQGSTQPPTIVVTDVRFQQEVDMLKSLGFVLIRVQRGVPIMDLSSEKELEDMKCDYTIENNKDIKALEIQVLRVIEEIKNKEYIYV